MTQLRERFGYNSNATDKRMNEVIFEKSYVSCDAFHFVAPHGAYLEKK